MHNYLALLEKMYGLKATHHGGAGPQAVIFMAEDHVSAFEIATEACRVMTKASEGSHSWWSILSVTKLGGNSHE